MAKPCLTGCADTYPTAPDFSVDPAGYINFKLQARGFCALDQNELADWSLTGDESQAQLDEMVGDYISELQTEKAEYNQRRRHPYHDQYDLGGTGHGDISYSDADPGL